ncbi:MAG TPA: hypothetical protein VE395_04725 [Acidimicrobiales bacterium]|jgi:hypothetical protein|nr:hypothetical protein [Acidimicrobiales bacterium]
MRRFVLATVVALLLAASWAPAAGAQEQPVDRVLVLSLPTVTWGDLEEADVPALAGLLERSAVGDLSTRSVVRSTSSGDGYTTVGAGTRARGRGILDGLSFEQGEDFGGIPADVAYQQRVGVVPPGPIFSLTQPSIVERNESLRYDAEVGALATALDAADVGRAVVANADTTAREGEDSGPGGYGRTAALALMGPTGGLPAGAVGPELLESDPMAPYGRRLDVDAVAEAFTEVWQDRSVVLVEASDLVRADAFRSLATSDQRRVQRDAALAATDELVGRILGEVDLERDAVVVVGPYHTRGRVHLTVAGVSAPGFEDGVLRSASTRRAGFVTLVDVAPTILDLLDVDRPDSMEGRPFERVGSDHTGDERMSWLAEEDEAALFRDRLVGPASALFVILNLLLWPIAVLEPVRSRPNLRQVVEVAALGMLGFLPFTYLAGLLPFHRWGEGPYWAFVLLGGLGLGVGALVVGRRRAVDPLLLALGAVLGLLVVDVVLGATLQLNTVFGYSPTVAGRFAGLGNLAFAQLAGSALLLAGVVAGRIPGRRGVLLAVGLLVVALVADGSPFWGSDVGGALTLIPAAGLTASLILGWRPRLRNALLWGLSAVAVVVVFGLLDLARPADDRTHLGRLFERVADDGWSAFETVVVRKLQANLSVLTSSVWTLMVPLALAVAAYLLWVAPGRLRRLRDEPALRTALPGLGVAGLLGFALNDSGIAVPGMMLGVVGASLAYLLVRTT